MPLSTKSLDAQRVAFIQGVNSLQRKVQDKMTGPSAGGGDRTQGQRSSDNEVNSSDRHTSSIEETMEDYTGFRPASFWVRILGFLRVVCFLSVSQST